MYVIISSSSSSITSSSSIGIGVGVVVAGGVVLDFMNEPPHSSTTKTRQSTPSKKYGNIWSISADF